MTGRGGWEVHCLDSRDMRPVGTASCGLVLSSPPYFPEWVEAELRSGVVRDRRVLSGAVREFVEGLAPVFGEIRRVLRPGGKLVLITRYLAAGGEQIPVTEWFRGLVEREGMVVEARYFLRKYGRRSPRQRAGDFVRGGAAVPVAVEDVMVYGDGEPVGRKRTVRCGVSEEEVVSLLEPLWDLPSPGAGRKHPHQMPREAGRRLMLLYSRPGEVVLDPFAGAAGLLLEGLRLGRRVVACEVDPRYAEVCRRELARAASHAH